MESVVTGDAIRFRLESENWDGQMNHHNLRLSRRLKERGAALITVLMVSVCAAMLIAASLTVASITTRLGIVQADSQAALQLCDAGINSEIQFISLNSGSATPDGLSSQPVVYNGVNAVLPGQSSPVEGRPGMVSGYSG